MYMHDPADANANTRDYLDSIWIEERLIDSRLADISMEVFGERYATPIMMPAFSHMWEPIGEGDCGMIAYAKAAAELPAVNWVGMMENDQFARVQKANPHTVRIVKPYADHDKVLSQLSFAAEAGALAIGMDTDHMYGTGTYDVVAGELMDRQPMEHIREYVSLTDKPFIIKGVLSVSDAVKCAECGVSGILISHHHGRLPYAIPPLMVLPQIKKAVEGSGMKLFVDCGMARGADVFKALALGADAVAVGQAMLPALKERGKEGVLDVVGEMNRELIKILSFTGCDSIKDAGPSMLWKDGRPMG